MPSPSLRKKKVSRTVRISPVMISPRTTAPVWTPWVTGPL